MKKENLVQSLAEAKVDDVKHRCASEDGAAGHRNEAEHGKAAVDELSLGGETSPKGRDQASSGLRLVAFLFDKCVLQGAAGC